MRQHLAIHDVVAKASMVDILRRSDDSSARSELIVASSTSTLRLDRAAHPESPSDRSTTTLLTVAALRADGIRARCGLEPINPLRFEDHWVCEFWHSDEQRGPGGYAADAVWIDELKVRHDA
jgi:hypothetical protein